jgi:hypothetical protein
MLLASGAMALGLVAAAIGRLPLVWDGAWFFVHALDSGAATFLFRRAIHLVLQAPAIAAGAITGDVGAASVAFSAAYVAVPLIALVVAWRIVRKDRPELIAWAALGISLVALPGQAFFISEGAIVAHLAWALILAAALGHVGRHRLLVIVLTAVMALSHPFAGPTLAAIGVVAWIARRRGMGDDGRLVAWSFLAVGIALTVVVLALRSTYEVEASSLGELAAKARASILDPSVIAPVTAWLIGVITFMPMRSRVRIGAILALLALATAILVPWALDPAEWASALRYRAWFVALAVPLFALAVVDVLRPAHWVDRRVVLVGAPVVMSLVLVALAVGWTGLQTRLTASIAASAPGCVTMADVAWVDGTPLDHWSITSLGLVLEGRDPTHLVLIDRPCADAVDPSRVTVKLTLFDRDDRAVDGWWGFGRLVDAWGATP